MQRWPRRARGSTGASGAARGISGVGRLKMSRNDLEICLSFWQRFLPLSEMMNISKGHFGFIENIFIEPS